MIILVAEDSRAYALLYKQIFESQGHTVVLANDGLECLALYANQVRARKNNKANPYDAVILDYRMPKKDGVETAKEILAMVPNQKILFITAFGDSISKMDFEGNNIELIQKPFNSLDLVTKVEGFSQSSEYSASDPKITI